jgi:hypothetical protein
MANLKLFNNELVRDFGDDTEQMVGLASPDPAMDIR